MKAAMTLVTATGWHGIASLSPDARIAALVLVAALVMLGAVPFFASIGIKRSARVAIITGSLDVTIIVILGILLVGRAGGHHTLVVFTPTTGVFGLAWGLVWAFLSFTGFESVASLAEETKAPKRNVWRCAFFAVLGVEIFYVFLAYAGVVGWGLGQLTGGTSVAYFAQNSNTYGLQASRIWPPFQWIVLLAVVNSVIACSLSALTFAARYFHSLGRLHLLRRRLARSTYPSAA